MYGQSTPRRKAVWLPLLTGALVCALMLAFALRHSRLRVQRR